MEYIVAFALVAFMIYAYQREKENREERRNLMDRLMSRSFVDYKRENRMDEVVRNPIEEEEPLSYFDN